ncbi:sigma-54 interaction domain-containing protein [Halomonas garicola]|uniref:sigma-54 interaction domain-containing protein n=1 Tax=Halomonas garicola TaxID=1690008 RepID=UPI00289C742B|nr:sigma-54 dependent transcriptional regulator [Halomonas garicola]
MAEITNHCWLIAEPSNKTESLIMKTEAMGWELHKLNISLNNFNFYLDDKCLVGLVFLDSIKENQLNQLEYIILKNHCLWIAVLTDKSLLEDKDTLSLVASLCHGFMELSARSEDLNCLMKHAASLAQIQKQHLALRRNTAATSADSAEYEMVGTTPVMHKLFETIRKVAPVEAPVFISGESGTGKELTALAIHERSSRASHIFHAINCGALPEQLVQSELFGHEKGAFTGAAQRKIGRIEAADNGTLFLDEIGDLPLEQQVNLLRFLETQRIQRVGGMSEISVNVRIVSATHINLEEAVKKGRFREDLYHRLNVLQVKVPALREHPEDIEILARYFFDRFSSDKPSQLKGFSREALQAMRSYHWPGNIRELLNRIRRAMVMCDNRLIQPEDLDIKNSESTFFNQSLGQARDKAEREALILALQRSGHKVHPAARELGVSRVTIYRLIEKHGLFLSARSAPG